MILEEFLIDFGLILRSIWGPKSVHNEVGNRVGMVIGKGTAKEGVIGANMGSKMRPCWVENRRKLRLKRSMEKGSVKKGVVHLEPRKFEGVGGPP